MLPDWDQDGAGKSEEPPGLIWFRGGWKKPSCWFWSEKNRGNEAEAEAEDGNVEEELEDDGGFNKEDWSEASWEL